ncbi:MAG: GHKL domain-containing protein [Bacillota bacterium]
MTFFSLVIVSFPEAILVAALGLVLAGVQFRWLNLVYVGTFQAGVAYLIRLLPVPFGLHSLILTAIFIIIIWLVMKLDIRLAAVAALLGLTVYVAIETVVSSLLLYLTSYPITSIFESPTIRLFFFLPQATLMGLLIWACLRFNFRLLGPPPGFTVNDDWQALNRSYLLVYLLSVLPVMLLGTLNFAFLTARANVFPDQYLHVFLTAMALAVLVLTALTPFKIQAIGRAVADACIARKNAESLTHIGKLLQLVRHQHHDFHHQLQTIYGLLETGCYEEARQFIRELHEAICFPLELIRTDSPQVMALLYTKLALAEARGIRLEPVIECSLKQLPLSPLETSTLLGNILDNALEAVEQVPPEERLVHLEIRFDSGGYAINVANRGRLENSQLGRISQSGYTTKEGHSGMGLASVSAIVAKYGGSIEAFQDGRDTVFRVLLPPGEETGTDPTVEKDNPV